MPSRCDDHVASHLDIGAIIEREHHLGDAKLGRRADVLQPWKPAHRLFDGKGDLLLNRLRSEGGAMVLTCT